MDTVDKSPKTFPDESNCVEIHRKSLNY